MSRLPNNSNGMSMLARIDRTTRRTEGIVSSTPTPEPPPPSPALFVPEGAVQKANFSSTEINGGTAIISPPSGKRLRVTLLVGGDPIPNARVTVGGVVYITGELNDTSSDLPDRFSFSNYANASHPFGILCQNIDDTVKIDLTTGTTSSFVSYAYEWGL